MSNPPTAPEQTGAARSLDRASARARRLGRRRLAKLSAAALLAPLLTACGAMPPSGPASPTAEAPGTPSAPATPSAVGTAKQGITIGDLANRVAASWPKVTSYRETATQFLLVPLSLPGAPTPRASPAATPLASPAATPLAATPAAPTALVTERSIVLRDQRRQRVIGGGSFDHEAVVIGGRLAARGPLVARLIPGTPPDAWVEIDPASLRPDDPAAAPLLALLRPIAGPPVAFPDRLRDQVVRPLGAIPVSGHSCEGYAMADTTATGEREDITLALDDKNRPCLRETRIGRTLL
ncbi:MAG TPA: hypothetical protein VFU81_00710, partial [Thermomicrobiales bacterium]|nr:hypothetical protein [Thermomicrobiales bacterium]